MTATRLLCNHLVRTLLAGMLFLCAVPPGMVHAADTLRPEVAKALQSAGDLMKSRKYAEAMAKVREADGAGGKNPYESFMIERMRGSIAQALGDTATALRSFESVVASGRLSGPEQLRMIQAVASLAYQAKDYGKAATWSARYFKEGGSDPQMRTLQLQSQFLAGDCASVGKTIQAEIQADENAGRAPPQARLELLANCYSRAKDDTAYIGAMEKLVAYYPKKDYWLDLLQRVPRKPGFADRLALDVYRLRLATGNMDKASDFMEMTQLALQEDYAGEARKIVAQGFSSGALGTGAEAERHKRLKDLADKKAAESQSALAAAEAEAAAAKEGTPLVDLGFKYVGLGQFDKGIALMEQGIRKGNLKRPEDSKLHLGIAYLHAGHKAKGIQMLKTVKGNDGTAELARLWIAQGGRAAS